jgi:hypothetical protein
MKVKNPFLHFPYYRVVMHLKDGRKINKSGMAVREIELPIEEEDALAVVIESLDSAQKSKGARMLTNGIWAPYSEAALEQLLSPPEPEPEPEPEPVVEEEDDVVSFDSEVDYEVDEEDEDE